MVCIGEPDAIANMCYLEVSERKPFQELFWDIWRSSGYALPTETHRSVTPSLSLPLSLALDESETLTKCFAVNASITRPTGAGASRS